MATNSGIQVPTVQTDPYAAIREQASQLLERVNKEGVTDNSGNILLPAGSLNNSLSPTIPPGGKGNTGAFDNLSMQGQNTYASITSQDEFLKWQQQQYQQNQEAIQKAQGTQEGYQTQLSDFMSSRQSTGDLINSKMSEYGVPENWDKIQALTPEIGSLNMQLAQLNTNEATEVNSIENNPQYSVQYSSRESSRVSREYDIKRAGISAELGAKTALVKAYQGNIEIAKGLISDIVDAMQYEDNLTLTSIDTFMDNNQSFINSLSNEQQNLLNGIQNYWVTKTENDRADYNQKLQWVVEAGLNLTTEQLKKMSLTEVVAMAGKEAARRQRVEEQNTKLGTEDTPLDIYDLLVWQQTYPDAGITAEDTPRTARAKIVKSQNKVIAPSTEENKPTLPTTIIPGTNAKSTPAAIGYVNKGTNATTTGVTTDWNKYSTTQLINLYSSF